MLKNKFTTIFLATIIFLALILGASCTPQQKPTPTPNNDMNYNTDNRDMGDNQTNNNNNDDAVNDDAVKKANRLASMITEKMPNINSTTVIYANENVYVGIDLHANISGSEAETVKNQVSDMVKKEYPEVNRVYVTEDADTFTRLQNIARDIETGKPLSGFLNELQNIFKRITPSMK